MNDHPIPQDVTGFQFKLIGSMTVKQFAYLAIPSVVAWILYSAPFLPWFIKFPLILIFIVVGLSFAFLPIEGRPADVMTKYFFAALFNPNQFIYHKTGRKLAFANLPAQPMQQKPVVNQRQKQSQIKNQQLQALLRSSTQHGELDERENAFMRTVASISPQSAPSPTPANSGFQFHLPQFPFRMPSATKEDQTQTGTNAHAPQTSAPILSNFQTVDIEVKAPQHSADQPTIPPAPIQPVTPVTQIPQAVEVAQPATQTTPAPNPPAALPYSPVDIQQILGNNQQNQQTTVTTPLPQPIQMHSRTPTTPAQPLQQEQPVQPTVPVTQQPSAIPQMSQETGQVTSSPIDQATATPMQPNVAKIPKNMAKSMGLPNVPDTPNLITGVVHDSRGNVLPNMLVEVKDNEGNPVRAFKTNQLGQFASATPLLNGTYTIAFEDPKGEHRFDVVEISAKGEILLPISIVSHDAREELRRALFT